MPYVDRGNSRFIRSAGARFQPSKNGLTSFTIMNGTSTDFEVSFPERHERDCVVIRPNAFKVFDKETIESNLLNGQTVFKVQKVVQEYTGNSERKSCIEFFLRSTYKKDLRLTLEDNFEVNEQAQNPYDDPDLMPQSLGALRMLHAGHALTENLFLHSTSASLHEGNQKLKNFSKKNDDLLSMSHYTVRWLDDTAEVDTRLLPSDQFERLVEQFFPCPELALGQE